MKILSKLYNLQKRTVVLTGAGGNLAEKISLILADLGADLILISRKKKLKNNYDKKLNKLYPNLKLKKIICDLSKNKSRNALIKRLNKSKIHILINNATFKENNLKGYASGFKEQNLKKWKSSLEINLICAFHLSQGLHRNLINSGNGSIINISSIYGVYPPVWKIYDGTNMGNSSAYASAKAGLIQLTKWLSSTLAPKVRVNSISPGGIFRNQPKKFVNAYNKKTLLNRMASEEDLMGIVAYLASDASSYVTGQNIIVDGGWGN
jgi:NAD(P)-dependent dehydrogenase (short-subunit alcohol dehydrogenase family)